MIGKGLGHGTFIRHNFFLSLVLTWLFLTAAPKIYGEADAPILLELTDPALIGEVWGIVHPDSAPPAGEYQILLNPGPQIIPNDEESEDLVHLIRNGTEAGRMDREEWESAANNSGKGGRTGWSYVADGAERQEVPLLWTSLRFNQETILAWSEWPASVLLGLSTSLSALPTSHPQLQRNLEFTWSQKLFRHYLLGIEIHRNQFGGGLTRAELERKRLLANQTNSPNSIDQTTSAFWGDGYWAWSLSAGVPGLKYTVALADRPLPEYFWLETRATPAIAKHQPGRVVTQWTGASLEKSGNLAHTFNARLGHLRYALHFDQDAYHMAIHTLSMDEMPALFGTWGTGLVVASSQMATRVWFDIPDLAMGLPHPQAYPFNFRFAFLRLDLAYRSLRNFNLSASVRLRIQNPILNLPGA